MLVGQQVFEMANRELFTLSLPSEARDYADTILQVAQEESVDPMIIAALGQRESRWGHALSPQGPGGTGDYGHGHGLMQIDDRSHSDFLDNYDWTDPYTNVQYAIHNVLKPNLDFFTQKGLQGDQLVSAAVAAYNAGPGNVWKAIQAGKSPDAVTTGRNYASDVLARAASAANAFNSQVS